MSYLPVNAGLILRRGMKLYLTLPGGQPKGPYDHAYVESCVPTDVRMEEVMAWHDGMAQWEPLLQVLARLKGVPPFPPVRPVAPVNAEPALRNGSRPGCSTGLAAFWTLLVAVLAMAWVIARPTWEYRAPGLSAPVMTERGWMWEAPGKAYGDDYWKRDDGMTVATCVLIALAECGVLGVLGVVALVRIGRARP